MPERDADVVPLDAARRGGQSPPTGRSGESQPPGRGGEAQQREASPDDEHGAGSQHTDPPQADPQRLEEVVTEALTFLRRRMTGAYSVDVFGMDRELTERVLLPVARPLYRHYWRVETLGLEHVPSEGGALVVGNHSGTLPFDAVMAKVALLDDHPAGRHLRELAADLAFRLPFFGPLARKSGNTLGHHDDAMRLLSAGELVGVWPEGFKGVGKRYRDRYKLGRFGRGGFANVALRTQAPIVPMAIVGAEEIYPQIGDVAWLARLFRLPYFPVTWQFPLLGPLGVVPLPTKWRIEFGEPIDTSEYPPEAADDQMRVFELTDRVRATVQGMVDRALADRESVFF